MHRVPLHRVDQTGGNQHQSEGRLERQPQTWLRARARLMPDLLPRSPAWVRSTYDHTWAPMTALAQQVNELPCALWDYLLECAGGFVYITVGESEYVPGPMTIRRQEALNVALVSVEDLARDNERPLRVIGHLIDHYLGCRGDPAGTWLSEGGGVRPAWQQASSRLPGLFELGYGVDEVAQSGVREYFGQSLAIFCRDRQRLNVADPQITKWFRSTLWNESFWRAKKGKEG
jgi:hypothetical protein